MYVCENVDPEKVFSQSPCPLSQPVLLSLIQQLSVDLAMYTDLKHKLVLATYCVVRLNVGVV